MVDDDVDLLDATVRALTECGYKAEGEQNAGRAISQIRSEAYSIVLVDIVMPDPGGLQVLMSATSYSPASVVIAVSGLGEIDDVLACIRYGAADFIKKPFDISDLVERMEVNVRRPQFELLRGRVNEDMIEYLWENLDEGGGQVRGRRLEQLLRHLIGSVSFFTDVESNIDTNGGEIDIEFISRSQDPFWRDCGSVIKVECKNWSQECGPADLDSVTFFGSKLMKGGLCKTGLFVSWSGFSEPTKGARTFAYAKGDVIIVPIDRKGLEMLVKSDRRVYVFQELIRNACRI